MKELVSPTWYINIWIAGNHNDATRVCREWCIEVGACVTVTPTQYVYTGGMEDGVVVRFLNYPRFPVHLLEASAWARDLAERLRATLCQNSYTIETSTNTTWVSYRKEDNA